jgi:hypothetical protein
VEFFQEIAFEFVASILIDGFGTIQWWRVNVKYQQVGTVIAGEGTCEPKSRPGCLGKICWVKNCMNVWHFMTPSLDHMGNNYTSSECNPSARNCPVLTLRVMGFILLSDISESAPG